MIFDERCDLVGEGVDFGVEDTQARDQFAGEPGNDPGLLFQPERGLIERPRAVEPARARLPGGVELVQVPAKSTDDAGSLGDEVLAVVDQEPHLSLGSVQLRDREIGFAQGGAGDGERVDRVRRSE